MNKPVKESIKKTLKNFDKVMENKTPEEALNMYGYHDNQYYFQEDSMGWKEDYESFKLLYELQTKLLEKFPELEVNFE